MPFLLIKGRFLPERGRPDGDSVRFAPDQVSMFRRLEDLAHRRLKTSTDSSGQVSVQLRYEGIDAMEKDAKADLPERALDHNKQLIGHVPGQVPEPKGHVLASGIEKNGRPIVFVFAGNTPQADGSSVFLTPAILRRSVNYAQAKAGFAYPIYYMSLYSELREELTAAMRLARLARRGVWAQDKSTAGFSFKTKAGVKSLPPIFPKLYRRLQKTKATSVSAFLSDLDSQGERVATLSDGRFLRFNDVLQAVGATKLRMIYKPEDLVFQEG